MVFIKRFTAKEMASPNVLLLFLIKHKEVLSEIDQPHSLKNLLLEMYPEGLNTLEAFLYKRYEQRGFATILPQIAQLMSQLEEPHVQPT